MKRKKQLNLEMIIASFLVSSIIFISGIFIGYSIGKEKISFIENSLSKISSNIQNFQLQFLFLDVLGENSSCPFLMETLYSINKDSYELGKKLESLGKETELKDYNEFLKQKREYSRMLVSYWLLSNKLKKICYFDADTIVYFYSRNCERCDDQAFVLTYLKQKHEEKLLIFTLDGDLDEPSIKAIKTIYNITSYPYLIINGNGYIGFISKDEIENLISLK
ncbi:MAG: hypothetical protein QW051_02340 [Candidatus Aenigmatarchaeota archaeon]